LPHIRASLLILLPLASLRLVCLLNEGPTSHSIPDVRYSNSTILFVPLPTTYFWDIYKSLIENINASFSKKDIQNAQITFTDMLKEKMINHIDSNFEVFKEYTDNPEFRAFLASQMFKEMLRDNSKYKSI